MTRAYHELAATAEQAAEAGAAVLTRYFRGNALDVRTKGEHDYVTRADHESEAAILTLIRSRHPGHDVLAEEGGATGTGAAFRWIVDPLDGTSNFLHGLPYFAVSIACQETARDGHGIVAAAVLDPIGGDRFVAARGHGATWNGKPMQVSRQPSLRAGFLSTGYPWRTTAALDTYLALFRDVFVEARSIRRCGAAALDLAYTAAGVYDGFFEFRLSPWDIAAGALLVEEAGGRVSDLDGGDRFLDGGNVLAGGARVHAELLTAVAAHADESTLDRLDPRKG